MDDVWINISSQHTVDFTDSEHYYNYGTGFDENGYYYVVLEYTYAKSRPAPEAKVLIVKPSQIGTYSPGGSWLFLKAVLVEGSGPHYITSVSNFDPGNPDNRRLFVPTYVGTEVGLPPFSRERDQSRVAYDIESDEFYFGYSDRWGALSGGITVDTSGFNVGDLVYVTASGTLSKAVGLFASSTADGVVASIGTAGRVKTTGKVVEVPVEDGASVVVGTLAYASATIPGHITDEKTSPFWQFVGRVTEMIDSTSVNMLFVRGEPSGTPGVATVISSADTLADGAWIVSGGSVYQDIDISSFDGDKVVTDIWDATTNVKIQPEDMEYISDDIVRVWMPAGFSGGLNSMSIGPPDAFVSASTVEKVTKFFPVGGLIFDPGSGFYYGDMDTTGLLVITDGVVVETWDGSDIMFTQDVSYDPLTDTVRVWMPDNTQSVLLVAMGPSVSTTILATITVPLASGGSWIPSGGNYYQDVDISVISTGVSDEFVYDIKDVATSMRIEPTDIGNPALGVMRVWMSTNTRDLIVTIIG